MRICEINILILSKLNLKNEFFQQILMAFIIYNMQEYQIHREIFYNTLQLQPIFYDTSWF